MNLSLPTQKTLIILVISIVTFFCFRESLNNQFTNWDDDYYVTNNQYIRAFTPHNLKVIFTQDITKNNYHPLCILSLAVNYHFAGLTPWSYYLTNILIHIANTILVFFLFIQLCRLLKLTESAGLFVASFGALWFGIHPMHVESVSWIAERKDVLYAFFYISGMLTYLSYHTQQYKKWLIFTLLLFIASCLSKPMAVVFPVSLLCLDLLLQRPIGFKLVLEKWHFFLLSLLVGGAAVYTQSRTGAVADFGVLTLAERIMYASYGFVMYVAKVFNPTHLSTFYPYPYRFITGELPSIYYAAPFLALGIIAIPGYIVYKWKRQFFHIYTFGMGFFIANVIFVLQFISVGAAIMADRYSYVAYIGLFFLLAVLAQGIAHKLSSAKAAIITALLLLSAGLAGICHERTKVWYTSETLLSDAIEKYPYRALLSYKWRGHYYLANGDLDKALEDYNLLATIRAADKVVLANIERIKIMKAMGGSIPMTNIPTQATNIDPTPYQTYLDSAITLLKTNDTGAAFIRYIKAIRANPSLAEKSLAENSNNLVQSQQYPLAILQYNMLLKLNASNPFYYFLRGCAYFGTNNMNAAISDWEIAGNMNNHDVQQSAAYNLSVAYDSVRKPKQAYQYVLKAQKLGYKTAPDFVEKLNSKANAAK